MNQIVLTMDLSDPKTKAVLRLLADDEQKNEPAIPETKEKQPKKQLKAKEKEVVSEEKPVTEVKEPVETEQTPEPVIELVKTGPTKLEVRAAALRLSKNGKSEELKKIFETYGAVNLSTLEEKDYSSAIADMEAVQI